MKAKRFPDGFVWGASTSAYQIEGAVDADGRGESIWDRFSRVPGAVGNGDTGDPACDHYNRWRDDVSLMSELGLSGYRFSLAWPRLFPEGTGKPLQAGIDHYDRLIDALLEKGITPLVTLYHWDLPQALQDIGGWRNREVVERFADYASTCFDAFGDRVKDWVTQNEPWIVGVLGHQLGIHAPGEKDLRGTVVAMHHLLLSHGRAVQALRASGSDGRAGVAFSLFPHYPASDRPEDIGASEASDGYVNRWFLDPVLRGSYPEDMRQHYERLIGPLDMIRTGDLDVIGSGSDFIGVNYYSPRLMRADPEREPFGWAVADVPEGEPVTDAGWHIAPSALTDLMLRLHNDYGDISIVITENGGVFNDAPHDARRIEFLRDHLDALHKAIEAGVPVRGYFHWSLMDNFEWAMGYAPRFGLVHVDYETQARTVKDSGRYYAQIARTNELPADE
ncbi:GH1 family beta-glucosidase [Allokutzneria sp. A3M-2-11 16]|uniref:GH1 family beta-glucosidase n=1 Tax=Allokutzneria sp. A3M-2-11 16 TaxID=2962043 RepID=UPI0020B7D385|nr:GH1 family beta-glucosidase [Allokutzneria sp. A3M-2-11 16]